MNEVFSCEFCEISTNTFFTEHLQTTATVSSDMHIWHSVIKNQLVKKDLIPEKTPQNGGHLQLPFYKWSQADTSFQYLFSKVYTQKFWQSISMLNSRFKNAIWLKKNSKTWTSYVGQNFHWAFANWWFWRAKKFLTSYEVKLQRFGRKLKQYGNPWNFWD